MPRTGVRGFRHDKLRELRRASGLTLDALAARLRTSRQAVSTWETGRSTPTAPMLGALARVLRTSIAVLAPVAEDHLEPGDLRVRAAMTQLEAAQRLGISATTLADIERGAKAVTEERVGALSALYGVDDVVVRAAWKRAVERRHMRAEVFNIS